MNTRAPAPCPAQAAPRGLLVGGILRRPSAPQRQLTNLLCLAGDLIGDRPQRVQQIRTRRTATTAPHHSRTCGLAPVNRRDSAGSQPRSARSAWMHRDRGRQRMLPAPRQVALAPSIARSGQRGTAWVGLVQNQACQRHPSAESRSTKNSPPAARRVRRPPRTGCPGA